MHVCVPAHELPVMELELLLFHVTPQGMHIPGCERIRGGTEKMLVNTTRPGKKAARREQTLRNARYVLRCIRASVAGRARVPGYVRIDVAEDKIQGMQNLCILHRELPCDVSASGAQKILQSSIGMLHLQVVMRGRRELHWDDACHAA